MHSLMLSLCVFGLSTLDRCSAFASFSSSISNGRAFVSLNKLSVAQQQEQAETSQCVDRSTLTLLEHINLNVPNHDYIIPFYVELLGLGLDPRKAENVVTGSKTVWVNCGASQFHLPYGETPQVIPGHVGLLYDDLEPLKQRVEKAAACNEKCFQSHEIHKDYVKLVDMYGNVFYCREKPSSTGELRQPLVTKDDTEQFGDVATKYGVDFEGGESECRGVDYVEFDCPVGSAEKIAEFYDSVLDATTSVLEVDNDKIAIIGFGNIDANGRPAQSLLFRETSEELPPYDGHHVAMYVGENKADFEQAFKNAATAGIVWVNPRFSDKAETLQGARQYKQFRFKDIIDMETGEKIMELEHEMRSIEHQFWPGSK